MKPKLLLWLAVANISTATWATEPEALNVHRTDGTITSTMFDDFKNLELSGDVIIVHQQSGETTTIAIDNVANILWGNYVYNTTTEIDNVRSSTLRIYHNGTQGVISSTDAILHYIVFDTLGRFVYSDSPIADTYEVFFPTQSWTSGIYLVCIETTAGKTSSKIIF